MLCIQTQNTYDQNNVGIKIMKDLLAPAVLEVLTVHTHKNTFKDAHIFNEL